MNLQDAYNILCLRETAQKEEVEKRYNEFRDVMSSGTSMEEMKALAEVTQAYHIIMEHLEPQKKKQKENPHFVLDRKQIFGKLSKVIKLHGVKVLVGGAIATGVIISVSAFQDLYKFVNSIDIGKRETPSAVEPSDEPPHQTILEDEKISFDDPYIAVTKDVPQESEAQPIETESPLPKTEKGYTIETKDGVTYVDGYIIANKSYPLPSDYVPEDTYKPITGENGADFIDKETMEAFMSMRRDALRQGLNLWIASGYRSYSYQSTLYNKYVSQSGAENADTYSARPGYSEHQTGLAFDLNSVSQSFANTREGIWVSQNCHKYGFIIRYPKGKTAETGYMYEPWHLRYVGVELASELYNDGDWITMEAHFGITSEYDYANMQEQGRSK